jgi:hypothetical protein
MPFCSMVACGSIRKVEQAGKQVGCEWLRLYDYNRGLARFRLTPE